MDIWEKLYDEAKKLYHPEEVSPFVYAYNVVCALECENGEIYTGICIESCSGMPCGACREFFMQLNKNNKDMEIMVDYETRKTITLEELLPNWWGYKRYEEDEKQKNC